MMPVLCRLCIKIKIRMIDKFARKSLIHVLIHLVSQDYESSILVDSCVV